MLKKTLAGAFGLALLAGTANAATVVTSTAFDDLPLSVHTLNVDFEGADPIPVPHGFTLTGSFSTETGSVTGQYAAPAGDATQYLVVPINGQVTGFADLHTAFGNGFGAVSFYWGSIDTYNSIQLLDINGAVFGSIIAGNSANVADPTADGGQFGPGTNRRVTLTQGAGDPRIYGVRFINNGQRAFELDNVSFGAVPEPATWAMMIGGFGLVGGAIRRRNRRTTMVTA